MNSTFYISAFLVGFLGSFHCAGMCGPIALALPMNSQTRNKMFAGKFLYNIGRIVTYSLLGLLFGLIGYSISLNGFQSDLSILTGVLIIVSVVLTAGSKLSVGFGGSMARLTQPLKNGFKKLFGRTSLLSSFFIGLLNGLLPCGFVYLALTAATASGNYTAGMLYMFLFGIGTLPMMFSISLIRTFLGLKFQQLFNKATPIIAIAVAVLLIYRGSTMKETGSCCKDKRTLHQKEAVL